MTEKEIIRKIEKYKKQGKDISKLKKQLKVLRKQKEKGFIPNGYVEK